MRARAAAALLLFCAPAWARGGDWRTQADALLERAGQALTGLEGGRCLERFSVERLVERLAAGAPEPDLGLRNAVMDGLELLTLCRAFTAGSTQACAVLRPVKVEIVYEKEDKKGLARPDTYDFLCASSYEDERLTRAMIMGDVQGAQAACLAHEAVGHHDFKEGRVKEACGLIARQGGDPEKTCRRLGPLFRLPAGLTYCRSELRAFSGDATLCPELGEPVAKELCLGNAAFKRLRASGRAQDCDAHPICRMLRGDGPKACRFYEERLAGLVCSRPPSAAQRGRDRASFEGALESLRLLLMETEAGDASSLGDLDDKAERAARLRQRYRKLESR